MPAEPVPLDTVNLMDAARFVDTFGDVAEHSPWVAEEAATRRPFADLDAMIAAFQAAVGEAGVDRQTALLNAHPDLAGRLAIGEALTADSSKEQAGAGLDRLAPEELSRFTELNDAYRQLHRIPFIFAVKGASKHDILVAFEDRIDNASDVELVTALDQVCRIIRFRLEDRVQA